MHASISTRKLGATTHLLQWLGQFLAILIGWRVEGLELLTEPKYVLVVAPHTSNWDVFYGLVCAHAINLFQLWKVGFLIKAEATRWPLGLGRFLQWMGGIPVERNAAQDVVDQVVEVIRKTERIIIAITPEGTRSRRDHWKTGFYRIALQAEVPIALAFLDFKRRAAGFGQIFRPTGDIETDFEVFRQFYTRDMAMHPELFGPVRPKPNARP
jgi:1-acyl-sn-glycerol-3-phosphate acyltransferase